MATYGEPYTLVSLLIEPAASQTRAACLFPRSLPALCVWGPDAGYPWEVGAQQLGEKDSTLHIGLPVHGGSTLLESFPKLLAAVTGLKPVHSGLETAVLTKDCLQGWHLAGVPEPEWQPVPCTNVQLSLSDKTSPRCFCKLRGFHRIPVILLGDPTFARARWKVPPDPV